MDFEKGGSGDEKLRFAAPRMVFSVPRKKGQNQGFWEAAMRGFYWALLYTEYTSNSLSIVCRGVSRNPFSAWMTLDMLVRAPTFRPAPGSTRPTAIKDQPSLEPGHEDVYRGAVRFQFCDWTRRRGCLRPRRGVLRFGSIKHEAAIKMPHSLSMVDPTRWVGHASKARPGPCRPGAIGG